MTTQATKHFIAVFMEIADNYKGVGKHIMLEQLDNIAELTLSFTEYAEYFKTTSKYFEEKYLTNKV